MIFNFGKPKLRPSKDYQWHKHFTIFPVLLFRYDEQTYRTWTSVVFMDYVERKWYDSASESGWIYRLPGDGN